MKKITSRTYFTTAEGERVSLTYSEIDENGNIIKENERVNRIVVAPSYLKALEKVGKFEQNIIDEEG